MPEISVIIPVYNTKAFLDECLRSVQAQTFRDFEAIIVDDGSTDNSADIIDQFVKNDSRFHKIHQENAGLSEARNTGLSQIKGNWITFVDSDDRLSPIFLEKLLKNAIELNADIACCGKKSFFTFSPKNAEPVPSKKTAILSANKAITNALYQNDKPDYSAWNKLYSTKIWGDTRFIKGIFFEDVATIPQVMQKAEKIIFIDEPLYLYRKRKTSILATEYNLKKAELLDIAETVLKRFENNETVRPAAQSNLLSASFSILMRTPNTEEFADYRKRAWKWIRKFRLQSVFDCNTRMRNKIAAIASYGGENFLTALFRRFG